MKILIIGSKGFIGSHCVKFFRAKGDEVIGCDVIAEKEENYIQLKADQQELNDIFKNTNYDCCINAAGSAHVAYSFLHPEKDFELNVSLVIDLLGAIKNNTPQCRFINFSSAAVYGNPAKLPVHESAVIKPLSPYGYHKCLSENLLLEYNRFFDLKTCSLRIFSAYGEGLKKQLFWDLFNKTKNAGSINLYGTGMESRDFIYIDDLIEIIHLVMLQGSFTGEVYNVANGEEIRIKDAVDTFVEMYGWKGDVTFSGEQKTGDPLNWQADIGKLRALGYKRKFSFEQGVKNYCQWLKESESH